MQAARTVPLLELEADKQYLELVLAEQAAAAAEADFPLATLRWQARSGPRFQAG